MQRIFKFPQVCRSVPVSRRAMPGRQGESYYSTPPAPAKKLNLRSVCVFAQNSSASVESTYRLPQEDAKIGHATKKTKIIEFTSFISLKNIDKCVHLPNLVGRKRAALKWSPSRTKKSKFMQFFHGNMVFPMKKSGDTLILVHARQPIGNSPMFTQERSVNCLKSLQF